VDDVQTPLISGIFSRTEMLSTLDLSSGLRDTKEPGLPLEGGLGFFMCGPREVDQTHGGTVAMVGPGRAQRAGGPP
jgi:hypothetical protein